ncbi:hydrogenase maturation nickel metallochaperone HypA [Thioalkalivibrio paradoxus]|uniref:Hydrogenase maturation factor HypA n=1 Tax=Thioalkalivibrio paradoxus ARh 1 TaxID=713585 RepID=W0DM92_9GAMM|nr:hydrogenase maturation nickel metallochaperone HypA [Thioalkalivibrio paradoxus]AHE98010.1 hydrogenase nickel incorporation protein HypA [Thioalkalivibrio paradoxus ARh 1]
MHEMSLAEGILQIIEDQAAQRAFDRVRRVRLEVGQLSGVEIDALRFSFDAVVADSIAAGAALEIVEVPGEGWCLDCNATVAIGALFDSCPLCGGYRVRASGGMDMRVLDLEVGTTADRA